MELYDKMHDNSYMYHMYMTIYTESKVVMALVTNVRIYYLLFVTWLHYIIRVVLSL